MMPLVLLVEDDRPLREVLAHVVQADGFAVAQAEDAQSALELLKRLRPDVMLLDIILPDKDGLEVIMEVQKARYGTRIIAMSAGGRTRAGEFFDLVKKLGVDGVLRKPFPNADLLRMLRSVLGSDPVGDVDLRYDGVAYRVVALTDRGRDRLFLDGIGRRVPANEARGLRLHLIGEGLSVLVDGQPSTPAPS